VLEAVDLPVIHSADGFHEAGDFAFVEKHYIIEFMAHERQPKRQDRSSYYQCHENEKHN
jgi:hypothetical protein